MRPLKTIYDCELLNTFERGEGNLTISIGKQQIGSNNGTV
jgi:hypothetical protein